MVHVLTGYIGVDVTIIAASGPWGDDGFVDILILRPEQPIQLLAHLLPPSTAAAGCAFGISLSFSGSVLGTVHPF
jgi:hypothetical protein